MTMYTKRGREKIRNAQDQAAHERRLRLVAAASLTARGHYEDGDEVYEVTLEVQQNRYDLALMGQAATELVNALVPLPPRQRNNGDVVAAIEAEGWHLEHVNYVFTMNAMKSRGNIASGEHSQISGDLLGVYLFRRAARRAA